jgi:hypothetical protein
VSDTPTTTVEIEPILCPAAGIYCCAFTIEQLEAFGRARVCCRSYLDLDVEEGD